MYNLTVAKAHTFFVGMRQWLVHNADFCKIFPNQLIEELMMSNLLEKSANEMRIWLDEALLGTTDLPEEQDLFTVAHHCLSGFLTSQESASNKQVWGKCTIILFQVLGILYQDARKRYKQDEIRARANLLLLLSNEDDNYLTNRLVIEQWFLESLELDIDIVRERAKQWQTLPKQEILQLRELKNRISVLESLTSVGIQFLNKDLYDWIDIKSALP